MNDHSISLWLAFRWAGPEIWALLFCCVLIPLIVLFGAWRWRWPQAILKGLSIIPIALTSGSSLQFLRLVHEVIFGDLGIDAQNAALGALGEIRLLLYAGFASASFSLLASCARSRSVFPKA